MTRIQNTNRDDVDVDVDVGDEEEQKIFEMRLLLDAFMGKPVLRDTIVFHLFRDYFDIFYNRKTTTHTIAMKNNNTNSNNNNNNNNNTDTNDDVGKERKGTKESDYRTVYKILTEL